VKRKTVLILGLVLAAASAWAQVSSPPGPEVKKLDYFLGTWVTDCAIGPGPWGMGGKFTATSTSEWMPGKFFVEGHSDYKMPPELGGDGKAVAFMGYDTQQNVYTFDEYNSGGLRTSSKGSLSGDTWTWTSSMNYAGQDVDQKMTMKVLSPTSYTMKFEVSLDGKNWMTLMEGKANKK
jgi:hypothetical protein